MLWGSEDDILPLSDAYANPNPNPNPNPDPNPDPSPSPNPDASPSPNPNPSPSPNSCPFLAHALTLTLTLTLTRYAFERDLPNCVGVRELKGSGHSPHLDNPEAVLPLLKDFILG